MMGWKEHLWDEWEVVSEIGSGAYGTVYKIRREDFGGTYYSALKVISFPQNKSEIASLRNENMTKEEITDFFHHFADKLSREFAVMERLKGNTHIVSYEDHKIIQHEDGIGCDVLIRMELLTPLSEHLNLNGCSEKDAVQLGIDICNALSLCEREKIIHRDIKPGNIFVSHYGDYKLGDFGIALTVSKIKERLGRSAKGTYVYMAPEAYWGKRYDSRIDTYSLGLILYRLMNYGRSPFSPPPSSKLSAEIIENANKRRLRGEPLPRPANASIAMSSIILKACAYNPENRYHSASEMQKALERCKAAQFPLGVSKNVAKYVWKAISSIQDFDGDTPDIYNETTMTGIHAVSSSNTSNEISGLKHDVKYEVKDDISQEKQGQEESNKKKVNSFFMIAGDL